MPNFRSRISLFVVRMDTSGNLKVSPQFNIHVILALLYHNRCDIINDKENYV
jgi:hypothetical protein